MATRLTVSKQSPLTPVHRLWQMLPHRPRRWIFDKLLLAKAVKPDLDMPIPSPETEDEWPLPFIVCGPLRAPTGIGEAARLSLQALKEAGLPFAAVDVTTELRQEAVVTPPAAPRAIAGQGTILFFCNPPQTAIALAAIDASVLEGKLRVASMVFEYQALPKSWSKHAELFHVIAAPSAFAGKILAKALHRPILHLPYPVASGDVSERCAKPKKSSSFKIVFIGDMKAAAARKNPRAVVEAVIEAFPRCEGIKLNMILRGGDETSAEVKPLIQKASEAGLDMVIDTRLLDKTDHQQRLVDADVFISLHRSEGFGLPIAEAMLLGIPTVATSHGAVAEYLSEATGFPIASKLVAASPLVDLYDPGLWAEPHIAAASQALRAIRDNPEKAFQKATLARSQMLTQFGQIAFRKAMEQRVWFQTASES